MRHNTRLRAVQGRLERLERQQSATGNALVVVYPPGASEDEIQRLRDEGQRQRATPARVVFYYPDNGRLEP